MKKKVAVFIPTRMGSTRLPQKALADVGGIPLIIRVALQARAAEVGDVIIACAEPEILAMAQRYDFQAVLTDPAIKTGTDRIYAAYCKRGVEYDVVVNLQGDMPLIAPTTIQAAVATLLKHKTDIGTVASIAKNEHEKTNPNCVRAIVAQDGRALYFTRAPSVPYGEGQYYHHIGLYAYTAASLKRYVHLPQSPLELRENLEQLRALDNGMSIAVSIVDDQFAFGVDVAADLEFARQAVAVA